MNIRLSVISITTNEPITEILAFSFSKDAYTPYTTLNIEFIAGKVAAQDAKTAWLYLDGVLVHRGYIDTIKIREINGIKHGYITSRGFTSQYMQNQLATGLYTNINLNMIMDNYRTIPYVTHERGYETSYIYVKPGSTLWDGILNISFKLYGKHPYVRGDNHIMINRSPSAQTFTYDRSTLLSEGGERDSREVIYYWSMEDLDGTHGNYVLTDTDAWNANLVRSRYFELDRRFLYDPQKALEFRDKMAMRGWRNRFITYLGYRGEDLFDSAVIGGETKDITSVKIVGSSKGIITQVGFYSDKFVNNT